MAQQPEHIHEDLRQRRTKKFLVSALLALMEERPFQELSVVDICQHAMVHRTTFYAHFEDKYALLRYAITQLQREFEGPDAAESDPVGGQRTLLLNTFRNALAFIRAHKGLYLSGFQGGGDVAFLLEEQVARELQTKLESAAAEGGRICPEIAAHFYAGAILSLIRWWLESDTPVSDQVLLDHLGWFVPDLRADIRKG